MKLQAWKGREEFTIGVELEIRLQDKKTFTLKNLAQTLHKNMPKKIQPYIHKEFASSLLEIVTPICNTPKQATLFIKDTLLCLKKEAQKEGVALFATGVYPNIHAPLKVDDNERYRTLKNEYGILLDDFSACGLHIHIGFASSTNALKAYNLLINYSPIFICILANSPIFQGQLTKLLSYRLSLFDRLSRAGLSPYFKSYKKMQQAYEKFFKSHTIQSFDDIWWDLRINATFGTLEIRVGDSVHDFKRIQAVVALFQALCLYAQNSRQTFLEPQILMQNRWNAIRHGWDGNFYEKENFTYGNFTKQLVQTLQKEGIFEKLNTQKEASMLMKLINKPNLAQKQIEIFQKTDDIKQILQFGEL